MHLKKQMETNRLQAQQEFMDAYWHIKQEVEKNPGARTQEDRKRRKDRMARKRAEHRQKHANKTEKTGTLPTEKP